MCGRYASTRGPEDLVEEFEVDELAFTEPPAADYNVAPTKPVYAVLCRPPAAGAAAPVRQLRVMSWGLVPSWSTDRRAASRHINARGETVAEKPAYRAAFAARRCLLPADGYFEWLRVDGRKQPYFVRPRDGGVLAMAGLYEMWRDPTRDADDPHRWFWTVAVVTTAAEEGLGWLHDRMPLVVPPERYAAWLDPEPPDEARLRGLLTQPPAGRLTAYPVSPEVNTVANNFPRLLDPVPAPAPDVADARLF
jgi:putative SOS response-associated peptidase YedK